MSNVIMLNVVMLNVNMLNVVMLNVGVPIFRLFEAISVFKLTCHERRRGKKISIFSKFQILIENII
jgi:hypothetical protein